LWEKPDELKTPAEVSFYLCQPDNGFKNWKCDSNNYNTMW
jgi:hypothetical protein